MATTRNRTAKPKALTKADAPIWSDDDADFTPREHVFSIGTVDYTMPIECSAAQGWQYACIVRQLGADAGFDWGGRELLGEDEYQQVLSWPHLTAERFQWLVAVVNTKLMAAVNDPKAGSR